MQLQSLQQQQRLLLLLVAVSALAAGVEITDRCEVIKVKECIGIGYNWTSKSGVHRVTDQFEARTMMSTFTPLISYKCSENLRFFLCSVQLPMCDPKWPKPIGPCRPLCEEVREGCEPVLERFGFDWPDFMKCSLFPERSDTASNSMCMGARPQSHSSSKSTNSKSDKDSSATDSNSGEDSVTSEDRDETTMDAGDSSADDESSWQLMMKWRQKANSQREVRQDCSHYRDKDRFVYVNHTGQCQLLCKGSRLFSDEYRQLAQIWIGALSALCAASSLATILTFLIDQSRFKYPMRPIVFMAVCYLCYSMSHFVRLIAGREGAACERDPASGKMVLLQTGLDNASCAVVFLLQYFFSTAASAWFVILVLTWLLQAKWKWSPEAVAKRSCYFHFPAWIVPVALTVCVLIVRKVEADELFGLCNVGNQNRNTLLLFVIIPNAIFFLLEVIFLLAGLIAMIRVRRHAKLDGQHSYKFDVLMGKICVFSIMYVIPTGSILGFNIYEYCLRDTWYLAGSPFAPSVAALLIKAFASLAIGMTTVLWICSAKTALTWRSFCLPKGRRGQPPFPKTMYQSGINDHMQQHQYLTASPGWPKEQQQQQQQHQQQQQQIPISVARFPGSLDKSHTLLATHHQQQRMARSDSPSFL